MTNTAILDPETDESNSAASETSLPAALSKRPATTQPGTSNAPEAKHPAAKSKSPLRAVPALVHGTNAAGAAVGAAYANAGPVGVAVLGVTGAVGAAVLYGRSRSARHRAAGEGVSPSAGRRRAAGGHGGVGLRRSGSPAGTRAAGGIGKGGQASGGGTKSKTPKNRGANGGNNSKAVGSGCPGRIAKAAQTVKNAANKLRRQQNGAGPKGSNSTKSTSSPGRLRRLQRAAARKLPHYLRCTGAGLITAVATMFSLPAGVLWGLFRTIWSKAHPLHAWRLPFRLARRMWRRMYRHSRRRHDREERADQLALDVNDPGKDAPMSAALTSNTIVLNGKASRFALAMTACYAGYIGYSPTGMMAVAAEYAGLPNAIRATAGSVRHLAVNCDQKYPCSRRVAAKLLEAYEKLITAGARADSMVKLFQDVHSFDIQRLVDPRTNEPLWNVTPLNTNTAGQMFLPGWIESGCVLIMVVYRTYEPAHMLGVGCEVAGFGLGLSDLRNAITVLYQRTRDTYPVDDRVTSELATLAAMVGAAADDAALAAKLFAADHVQEISHNLHPRKGSPTTEGMWNAPRS